MKSLPVRIFHAFLSGAIFSTVLCVLTYQLQTPARGDTSGTSTSTGETSGTTSGSGSNSPAPTQPPPINPTPEDLDGDGIPNTWEEQFHHDANNAGDAGADFDNDGLTALEEHQLYLQTSTASGNPLGLWATEILQVPADLGIPYFQIDAYYAPGVRPFPLSILRA